MSTKIYNGFRVRAQTLDEAFHAINTPENRAHVAQLFEDEVLKYTSRIIARVLDRAALYPDDEKIVEEARYPAMRAHHKLREDQKEAEASGRNHTLTDFELELSLIPIDGGVIGILFTAQDSFRNWFFGLPCIEDYSYWDNTDRPDEVTDEEWEHRGDTWEKALPGITTPAQAGVTLQMTPSQDNSVLTHPREDYVRFFKPVTERARAHATDYIMSMKMRALEAEDGPDEDIAAWSGRFWDADRYVRSPEGQEAVERLAIDYERRLPDLTQADMH